MRLGAFMNAEEVCRGCERGVDECTVSTLEVEYSLRFESAVAAAVGRARSSTALGMRLA